MEHKHRLNLRVWLPLCGPILPLVGDASSQTWYTNWLLQVLFLGQHYL